MSLEQAKAAIEKLKTDKGFTAKVLEKKAPVEMLKVINSSGFECTLREIEQVKVMLKVPSEKVLYACDGLCVPNFDPPDD